MSNNRVETTLFLLQSVDGKISTGDIDERDQEVDFPKIKGIKEGLYQYYEFLLKTDRHALITGTVLAKIGVNTHNELDDHKDVNMIVIDRKPHLTKKGVNNLLNSFNKLYLVTNNKNHPVFDLENEQELETIFYPTNIDLGDLLIKLKQNYNINKVSIQSGGTLNALFLKQKLIDHISIIIAPCLVGGKTTPTSIDGNAPRTVEDLLNIRALTLRQCKTLNFSYLYLYYDVINDTRID
ncbi:MAG: dihydrofolate reductase family protein [Candidatus Hodarchaeota archaeon]